MKVPWPSQVIASRPLVTSSLRIGPARPKAGFAAGLVDTG